MKLIKDFKYSTNGHTVHVAEKGADLSSIPEEFHRSAELQGAVEKAKRAPRNKAARAPENKAG